jgi:endonuclease/exonuclease/phosphatase family metal-dependent hydrolase
MRVLTWNLMHGRSVPGAGRELFDEFAGALANWEWDFALLQEVPPWWPERLPGEARFVLTSRNFFLRARRAIATRWPDVIKSNGGGANAILVRGAGIVEHRVTRLGWWPERRWVHGVRLDSGLWVANTHTEASVRQGEAAADAVCEWAGEGECVFGGDFNVAPLELPGFAFAGGEGVDQVFVQGLEPGRVEVLERGSLSDHAPIVVSVYEKGSQ